MTPTTRDASFSTGIRSRTIEVDYFWSAAGGLVVGLALGWFGHVLSNRRTKNERAVADATELWDRCTEVASARIAYVLAYHRRLSNHRELKQAHEDVKRRFRWADPQVILKGTSQWEAYYTAERSALTDDHIPKKEHISRIDAAGYALLEEIGRRRADARK